MAALQFETICPACLERYSENTIDAEYSTCPECASEAMEIDVIAYSEYLSKTTIEELKSMQLKWAARERLRVEFKSLVAQRIDGLLRDKNAL